MKALAVALLCIIAAGVGYLAYAKYKEHQAIQRFASAMSDPEGYYAREWADMANMDCKWFEDVELITMQNGGRRPTRFTCVTSDFSRWSVKERNCSQEELDWPDSSPRLASGEPRSSDQVFRSLVLCWSVDKIQTAGTQAPKEEQE